MTDNDIILSSLAMDLKRVALGLHRKSFAMADRFTQEALRRKNEANLSELKPYMRTILNQLESVLANEDVEKRAEDALMYSTLIQNHVVSKRL